MLPLLGLAGAAIGRTVGGLAAKQFVKTRVGSQFTGAIGKVAANPTVQNLGGKYAPNLLNQATTNPGKLAAKTYGAVVGYHAGKAIQTGGSRATNFLLGSDQSQSQSDSTGGMY